MDLRDVLIGFLCYFLLPLWLLAGVADYLCHRRTRIEATSGAYESRLHVLQAVELGIAIGAGLFLEINLLVLLIMSLAVVSHSATSLWDSSYTNPRRYISPLEQHIHSYLDMIPVMALAVVAFLHWDEVSALFRPGGSLDLALQWKERPIPAHQLTLVIGTILLVNGLPLFEEFWRTRRV